jgi:hypothetical protein
MGYTTRSAAKKSAVNQDASAKSVRRLVLARCAAAFAIEEAVDAEPYIELGLAIDAELLASATRFGTLALRANNAGYARFRRHG